ncbi:carbohydrate-binding module family 13 protein [Rhizophagus irregularis DAOM 181602=DAOM 197198]|nr:carbohydrate-binding module family 13 protein [Rhizophagus irregularis DAOM 181602=DAOM 197198]
MKEIQVWEHVIKWGLAQNPELSSDITKFSKNDFIILKNTIQQCTPFIKFYNLTSKEFISKVVPHKKILSKELYDDLLNTYLNLLDPDSKPSDKSKPNIIKEIKLRTVDSKIITYQHTELISKWIDKLEISDELTSSYDFKLLFRGSRDGFSGDKFHEICDNKSRTVTIIKVKDSNEIIGGYNPIQWTSEGDYGTTIDSFIFSFNNNDRIENHILSRVMNEDRAIVNDPYYGPSFGIFDIIIWPKYGGNICKKCSYEKPIRKTDGNFTVKECEVFQIDI